MHQDDEDFIHHTLACPKGQFLKGTGVSFSSRHDRVIMDALVKIPRLYGIPVSSEPLFYCGYNEDGRQGRPDVEYAVMPRIVVDLSIVSPDAKHPPGYNAHIKAEEKIKRHDAAVKAGGGVFVPFIMETNGYLHHAGTEVIKALARHVVPYQRPFFHADIRRAIAISLVREVIRGVTAALHKHTDALH